MAGFHASEHVCCSAKVSEIGTVSTSGCDGKGGEKKKGTQGVLGVASIFAKLDGLWMSRVQSAWVGGKASWGGGGERNSREVQVMRQTVCTGIV